MKVSLDVQWLRFNLVLSGPLDILPDIQSWEENSRICLARVKVFKPGSDGSPVRPVGVGVSGASGLHVCARSGRNTPGDSPA